MLWYMTSVGPQQFAGPLSGHYFCPSSPHVCFSWICPQLDKPASRPKSKKLRAPNDPTVLPLSVCYIHSGYIFLRAWSGLAPVYSGKCTSWLCVFVVHVPQHSVTSQLFLRLAVVQLTQRILTRTGWGNLKPEHKHSKCTFHGRRSWF